MPFVCQEEAMTDQDTEALGKAMAELLSWCRKHYKATITIGPAIMPGDEFHVMLKAAGREAHACAWDVAAVDEGDPQAGTEADAILEALRRWHSDKTPKVFHAFLRTPDDTRDLGPCLPMFPDGEPEGIKRNESWGREWHRRITIVAATEAEALALLEQPKRSGWIVTGIYERGKA